MNLVEHLARVIELANGHANVGIGRHANAHAQFGTALGDLAAYGPMLSVDTVFKTMVVDLDNLVLGLSANSTSSISNGTPERPVWPSMNTLGCSRALMYIWVVWASVAPSANCGLCTLATK